MVPSDLGDDHAQASHPGDGTSHGLGAQAWATPSHARRAVSGDQAGDQVSGDQVSGDQSEPRRRTQSEIDAEIAALGDVPMYVPAEDRADDLQDPAESSAPSPGHGIDATLFRPADDGSRADRISHEPPAMADFDWVFDAPPAARHATSVADQRPARWGGSGDPEDASGPATEPFAPVAGAPAGPAVPASGVAAAASLVGRAPADAGPGDQPLGNQLLGGQVAGNQRPGGQVPAGQIIDERSPERRRASGQKVLIGTLVLALCLSLGGIAAVAGSGLLFPGSPRAGASSGGTAASGSPSEAATPDGPQAGNLWDGEVAAIQGVTADATCVAAPGKDSAGNEVPYAAANAVDGDPETGWRCDDDETPTITFTVPADTSIAEVSLINGYAKMDPTDDTDRYPLYRRALQVRWTFADGTQIEQELKDDTRSLQRVRVPVCAGGEVTLQIIKVTNPSSNSISRDSVVLSEVAFAAPQA